MNQKFTMNYEAAVTSANNIEAARAAVETGFNAMKEEVNSKIGTSVWSGSRADAFKSKWNEFAQNFDACVSQLRNVRQKVEAAHETYQKLDQ